jgi:hypothetical protein
MHGLLTSTFESDSYALCLSTTPATVLTNPGLAGACNLYDLLIKDHTTIKDSAQKVLSSSTDEEKVPHHLKAAALFMSGKGEEEEEEKVQEEVNEANAEHDKVRLEQINRVLKAIKGSVKTDEIELKNLKKSGHGKATKIVALKNKTPKRKSAPIEVAIPKSRKLQKLKKTFTYL